MEGGVAPLDTGSKVVEVDEVLHDALVIMHLERFLRSASASPSGSWDPKLFFNSPMKLE